MYGTILGNVDIITYGVGYGTELVTLDEPLDGSNDVRLKGLFFGY